MTDAERTMREEQWMLTQEFVDEDYPIPPIVAAFKLIHAAQWEMFLRDIDDNAALRFFNPELNDFSCAASWEELATDNGIEPCDESWGIDPQLPPDVQQFCRELRAHVRHFEGNSTGGQKVFERPAVAADSRVLTIYHDGGPLAPYFNPSYELPVEYALVDQLLRSRNLWREMRDCGTTDIYRS